MNIYNNVFCALYLHSNMSNVFGEYLDMASIKSGTGSHFNHVDQASVKVYF